MEKMSNELKSIVDNLINDLNVNNQYLPEELGDVEELTDPESIKQLQKTNFGYTQDLDFALKEVYSFMSEYYHLEPGQQGYDQYVYSCRVYNIISEVSSLFPDRTGYAFLNEADENLSLFAEELTEKSIQREVKIRSAFGNNLTKGKESITDQCKNIDLAYEEQEYDIPDPKYVANNLNPNSSSRQR
jgi:hypothetical protein